MNRIERMILITPYYVSPNEERNAELKRCLFNNLSNVRIDKIILLCDTTDAPVHDKILPIFSTERPTYADAFGVLDKYLLENPRLDPNNTISIVCNSDIYFSFDDTIILQSYLSGNNFLALSRWDVLGNETLLHKHWDSQDSWIFKGKILPGNYDFKIGIPGCDNRIAYELIKAGYNVINPCYKIKSYHLHNSGYRNYDDSTERIEPPYEYINQY